MSLRQAALPIALVLSGAAAPPGVTGDAPILVTGERIDEEQARREATEFVRAVGVANGETPVARWIDPICPKVAGLSAEHAAIVAQTIRERAGEIGARVARRGCRANVVIVFTDNGRRFAQEAIARAPAWAATLTSQAKAALVDESAPIRWWYTHEVRSRDGRRGSSVLPPWTGGNAQGGDSSLPVNGDTMILSNTGSSVISTQVVRALTSATVVIDANLADGRSLDAVSAYAAFAALAEVKQAPPSDSILSLFLQEGVTDLTGMDRRFLTALYRLPLDRRANQQRQRLIGALVKDTPDEPRR